MAKRATVYDVAQRAGVSIATVSFAFRQPHRVKQATLEAVLEAARELSYLPSASARGLARGRTGAIGLFSYDYLLDEDADIRPAAPAGAEGWRSFPLYVDEVQHGVELECRRLGYALMVSGGHTEPTMPPVVDVAGRVDGLITFADSVSPETLRELAGRMPVVALGTPLVAERLRTVPVDNAQGMRDVVEHLISVHGHRRFAYIGGFDTAEFVARYNGFAAALSAAGLPVPTATPSSAGHDHTTVAAVQTHLRDGLPDVFVCSTDQEALVAIDALGAAGVAVPAQVAVTGFDGIVAGMLSTPPLTTARQPMELIGRTAVATVVGMLDAEGASAEQAPRDEPLPVRLEIRASCGCG